MLNIFLKATNERFVLKDIHFDSTVRDLKVILEIICGIPAHLQWITYLDEGDLLDKRKLKYYDPVPGATFVLTVWHVYEPIVQAVVAGDEAKLSKLGVLPHLEFSSPIADRLSPEDKLKYINERASVAMFTAAHREKLNIVEFLCRHNVGINYQTASGRTPLMVAAAHGSLKVMTTLLEHNANVDMKDVFNQTADDFAVLFNNTQSKRVLIQFRWKKRMENSLKKGKLKSDATTDQGPKKPDTAAKKAQLLAKISADREKQHARLLSSQERLKQDFFRLQSAEQPSKEKTEQDDEELDKNDNISEKLFKENSFENGRQASSKLIPKDKSLPVTTQQQQQPKLFATQFYDVYSDMSYDDFIKIKNAFISQYFN
ncbi:unnamed protein product [Didymodactylos carnosus]|uniref:Ubiquitin-like domain-containing protein n=1 Tax=Didymodactylos carnosus TaxID=1234261 RepID=A0A813Q0V7_9BILA|nr:unnamed protein product [Didymodactylos carnosus]CAF0851057.1 unnamed protein product [Didymodactylos carnosus]CAF3540061.1 unnamed protein product [Didymodactylos carnosus]CAF3636279.1 unnamed protein product [Didymodactylos carnosus]